MRKGEKKKKKNILSHQDMQDGSTRFPAKSWALERLVRAATAANGHKLERPENRGQDSRCVQDRKQTREAGKKKEER